MGNNLSIPERVSAGIAFLNERVPGWSDRIDLEHLDLSDPQECILGQLFQSYPNGLTALGLHSDKYDLGFTTGFLSRRGTWADLTDEWKRQIGYLRENARMVGKYPSPW